VNRYFGNKDWQSEMLNKLHTKVGSSRIIFTFLVLLGLTGLFTLVRSILVSAELKIEEEYTLNPSPMGEFVSIYMRKFRCLNVKQVQLHSFYLKAGKATTIWDGDHTRESGNSSSSCLFTLASGSQFKSPWAEFSFSGGSSSSGAQSPLPINQFMSISLDSVYEQETIFQSPSEKTSLSLGKPVMLYLRVYGTSASLNKIRNLPILSSIQEVKDLSSKHEDLEFLAIDILWSK
jgi:hypothetical protein